MYRLALVLVFAIIAAACGDGTDDRTAPAVIEEPPSSSPAPSALADDRLEPGVPTRSSIYMHCGIEWLGEYNGLIWHTPDPAPAEWQDLVGTVESLPVELVLTTGAGAEIEATAFGATVTYRPTSEPIPGCD